MVCSLLEAAFSGGKKQMLKDKLATVLVVLTLALLLAPAASQAAPLRLSDSGPVASFFDQIAHWWDLVAGHTGARIPAPRAANLPKNGCGIDPNGAPCPAPGPGPDPGTQSTTPPDPGTGGG
jgi:hypothetical protein